MIRDVVHLLLCFHVSRQFDKQMQHDADLPNLNFDYVIMQIMFSDGTTVRSFLDFLLFSGALQ